MQNKNDLWNLIVWTLEEDLPKGQYLAKATIEIDNLADEVKISVYVMEDKRDDNKCA